MRFPNSCFSGVSALHGCFFLASDLLFDCLFFCGALSHSMFLAHVVLQVHGSILGLLGVPVLPRDSTIHVRFFTQLQDIVAQVLHVHILSPTRNLLFISHATKLLHLWRKR